MLSTYYIMCKNYYLLRNNVHVKYILHNLQNQTPHTKGVDGKKKKTPTITHTQRLLGRTGLAQGWTHSAPFLPKIRQKRTLGNRTRNYGSAYKF